MTDPKHFDGPQPGWEILAPGFYVDPDQTVHVFPGEILVNLGILDTMANREMLSQKLQAEAKAQLRDCKFYETSEGD